MWFVLLGIALVIVTIGGLYFRRRVLASLGVFGVSRRAQRAIGMAILWLIFGVPVLTFLLVVTSLALGRDSFVVSPTGIGEWLIVYPFWMTILVMLQSLPFLIVSDLGAFALRRRVAKSGMQRLQAIICFAVIGAFAIYTPLRIVLESDSLEVRTHDVHSETASASAGAGAGAGSDRLRIAFLADLQLDHHTNVERAGEVISIINDKKPDLVLSGGDWINTGSDYIDAAGEVGAMIESRLGVYSVRGDHEHFGYRDQERSVEEVTRSLAAGGVEMIDNEVRTLTHAGKQVAILYLSYNYIYRTPAREIRSLLDEAGKADYSILVTHQFDSALAAIVKDRVDLALIAHTHGGQVNPFVGFAHLSIARVETPYVTGRYQLGKTTLIVTSGIGFSIAPFRYAAPASLEIVDIHL